MSRPGTPRRQANPSPAGPRRVLPLLAGVAVVVGLVAVGASWWNQSKPAGAPAAFQTLEGRWQRSDGGYVLDIRGADADGTLTAFYFNPRPINVERSEASILGDTLKVFIELRDENYPGSTYQLSYDREADRLRGTYFQAMLRETYEVEFGRVKR